jgi:tetratricopeptide (TPR) repeat protein
MYSVQNERSVLNPSTFNNPPCPVRVTVTKAVTIARAAWANERAGNTEEALTLYARAMETLEPTMPPSHWEVAIPVLNNWAALLRSDGRFGEAEKCYLNAVSLLKGERNAKLASVLSCVLRNLADLYHSIGRTIKARNCLAEAEQHELIYRNS